jgi:hypothetical protein
MTNKDLNALYKEIGRVVERNGDTKVGKKMLKIFERIKPALEQYQKEVDELRLDNALTDEKDVLVLDEKGEYKFTKDGLRKLTSQINDLNNRHIDVKVIEVVNPNGLEEFAFLKGWVTGVNFVEDEEL